jgi:hypothetical protein
MLRNKILNLNTFAHGIKNLGPFITIAFVKGSLRL